MSVEFFQKGKVLQFESLIHDGTANQSPSPLNPNIAESSQRLSTSEPELPLPSAFKQDTDKGKMQDKAKQLAYVPPRQSSLFGPKHKNYS